MLKRIFVTKKTYLLEKNKRGILLTTWEPIPAGTNVKVGEPESLEYDGNSEIVYPVIWKDKMYYLMEKELVK
jgi:hypothetical protein